MTGIWLAFTSESADNNDCAFESLDAAARYAVEQPQISLRFVRTVSIPESGVPVEESPKDPMDLYDAAVEPMTPAQGRMIWAMITKEHGFTNESDAKVIIKGIVRADHQVEIESTKELSKVWAGDVITYLQKHTKADLQKFVIPF